MPFIKKRSAIPLTWKERLLSWPWRPWRSHAYKLENVFVPGEWIPPKAGERMRPLTVKPQAMRGVTPNGAARQSYLDDTQMPSADMFQTFVGSSNSEPVQSWSEPEPISSGGGGDFGGAGASGSWSDSPSSDCSASSDSGCSDSSTSSSGD